MTRLGKYLALSSVASRRKSEELIFRGLVKVNKQVIMDPAYNVKEDDLVEYGSIIIKPPKKVVIALNKPPGYLSTCRDDFKRNTVLDIVKIKDKRLYPVGRLDFNSRGLIILTNDGDLAYQLTHPKFNITKTYLVRLNKPLDNKDMKKIQRGVKLDKKTVVVKKIKRFSENESEIVITEGRKRVIRRLFNNLGYRVEDLKRTMIGSYGLSALAEGSYVYLNEKNIEELKKIQ
jgi:23S rRNA pseudouridine2605 synthase